MRRLLAAAALAASFFLIPAPAHADPVCEYAVPEVPGECLTAAAYAHIVSLTSQRDDALEDYALQRQFNGGLRTENTDLRGQLWEAAVARQRAEAQASMARSERDIALDAVDYFRHRTNVLKARVQELRAIIRGAV